MTATSGMWEFAEPLDCADMKLHGGIVGCWLLLTLLGGRDASGAVGRAISPRCSRPVRGIRTGIPLVPNALFEPGSLPLLARSQQRRRDVGGHLGAD
jgi:hypothetical protein